MLTLERIRNLVGRDASCVLDIGCNDGEHTQMFLNLFPSANIFCFEPDPRAANRFRTRVQDDRVQLFEMALGSVDGHMTFYQSGGWPGTAEHSTIPEGWDMSGSIRKPTGHLSMHPWCTFDKTIETIVMRLDTWADGKGVRGVDFIWADVQGAEGDLVSGGLKTLLSTDYFYVEYSDRELYKGQVTLAQLCAMLPQFEVEHVWANDVLFRNKRVA